MALTRRQFIRNAGMAVAGSCVAPGWFANPMIRRALAEVIGDRYFVVIDLGGGNDGLNTVVPYENGEFGNLRAHYESHRTVSPSGGLRILQSELSDTLIGSDLHTATPLALHPVLAPLARLYDRGKVAIVQGCGYPQPTLSHVESEKKWLTADPLQTGLTTGWMGRYLASRYTATDVPALSTQEQVPGEFAQFTTVALAQPRIAEFSLPLDTYDAADVDAKIAGYTALYAAAQQSAVATLRYAGNVGSAVMRATQVYPQLHDAYVADRATWNNAYDASPGAAAQGLREIAKTIYGVLDGKTEARFFEVLSGGFDTHADQGNSAPSGKHTQLLADLGTALEVFYEDCTDMGVADKLCIFVWTEFGRRVPQNDNGTDHGTQCPVFVIGGAVNGGIYGNHPNIAPAALDAFGNTAYSQLPDDPYRSTDFRDVYGTMLKHWLRLSDDEVRAILPLDGGDPDHYWTMPNFNLPFLA